MYVIFHAYVTRRLLAGVGVGACYRPGILLCWTPPVCPTLKWVARDRESDTSRGRQGQVGPRMVVEKRTDSRGVEKRKMYRARTKETERTPWNQEKTEMILEEENKSGSKQIRWGKARERERKRAWICEKGGKSFKGRQGAMTEWQE